MKKYLVVFLGTFFLVLSALLGGGPAAAAVLVVMVYAGAHISGAHYNPAVSLGLLVRGKLSMTDMLGYWGSQVVGGVLAAMLACHLQGACGTPVAIANTSNAIIAEALGTFALAFVVITVATTKSLEGNQYFGLAIGGTVLAMALTLGSFSGGAFNPAVALGVAVHTNNFANLWIYLVSCLGGGLLAGYVYNFLNSEN